MRINQRKLIFLAILMPAVFCSLIVMARVSADTNTNTVTAGVNADTGSGVADTVTSGTTQGNKYPFTRKERDPFSPLVTESGQVLVKKTIGPAGLVLKGILYSRGQLSVAIIGDEVFKENDIIGDYKVIKIDSDKVTLKKDEETITLKLEETDESD